jgi:predicted MFS family arabinose efflux permease
MPSLSRPEWSLVLTLAAINFTHLVDFVIVMPLGNRLMTELDITPQQYGRIVSAYGIAAALAGVAFAAIADRFDRKQSLLGVYAGLIVATLACGLARGYLEMIVARLAAGAFGGVAASSLMAIVGDRFEDQRRGTATGVVMAAFALASVVGLPIGIMLANRFGRGAPFLAIAALSVPVWIMALFVLPPVNAHMTQSPKPAAVRLWHAAKDPGHLRAFAFMFFLVLGTFTIIPFLVPYLEANAGRHPDDIPTIYFMAGFVTLVSTVAIGRLTDRWGKMPIFLGVAVGSIVMTLVLTNLPEVSYPTAAIVTTLFMVLSSGRVVPAQALMQAAAEPASRGAFTNLNSAISNCGIGLAPFLGSLFLGRDADNRMTGYPIAGLLAATFALIAIILAFRVRRPSS